MVRDGRRSAAIYLYLDDPGESSVCSVIFMISLLHLDDTSIERSTSLNRWDYCKLRRKEYIDEHVGCISVLFLGDDGVELLESEVLVGFCLVEDMRVMHHFHDLLVIHSFS